MLLVVLALLGGCSFGGPDGPRIGMETDQTDILFGTTTTTPAAEAAAAVGVVAEPIEDLEDFPQFRRPIQFGSPTPTASCPEAPPLAAVSQESGTEVKETPREGSHRWIPGGTYGISGSPNAKIPVPPTSVHYVKPSQPFSEAVAPPPGSPQSLNFTYQTIEPRIGTSSSGLWQFHWKVKSNSSISQDPEGGLALTRIDVLGDDGRLSQRYFTAFGAGLLLIPFPVRPGGTWNTASVDTAGGNFSLSGQVLSRDVIDACGTLVQGWHVHSSLTQGSERATLDYLIATQYGGQIISMRLDGTFLGTIFNPASFRIGQLDPDPLPARFR